jgi:drug/metabolite transporter (DMT)-like permease
VIFVVPVFGVLWGALFLGETIHIATIAGGAVILASVWLITRNPAPPPPPARARTAEVMSSAR